MCEHETELLDAWRKALRPDPRLTVSEWAERFRWLDETTPEPGPWRNSRTPYLTEIMDSLSPSDPCERVVLEKGTQLGGTQTGNNWLGMVMHAAPGPMMMVQPTLVLAKRWAKLHLDKIVETTPVLASLLGGRKTRDPDQSMYLRKFPGGFLVIAGANSAAGLRSSTVRFLFADEVDAYPPDADGEGDPLDLAMRRTQNFAARKVFLVSTPTTEGMSRIQTAYEEGDQRKYYVPCPVCDEYQVLEWAQVRWPPGRPLEAQYSCIHCGVCIDNHEKTGMLARGEWRATEEGDGRTRSYHLSSLYSPVGWLPWGEIADEFIKAGKDPLRLQTWVNTMLGQVWKVEDGGETVDPDSFEARCEEYSDVPADVAILTAGVDVQGDRLEVEVVGWGRGEESWSVEYKILYGDTSVPQVWDELDAFLQGTWRHPALGPMHLGATAVDTGFQTQMAYDFVEKKLRRRIFAIKGVEGSRPVWPPIPGKARKGTLRLYPVGVDTAKRDVYARLKIAAPGPGYCHFPRGRGREYFSQLTAETLKVKYHRGHPTYYWYLPPGRRNEALDCRAYAYAALHGYYSHGLNLDAAVERLAVARKNGPGPAPAPVAAPARPSYLGRNRGWLGG